MKRSIQPPISEGESKEEITRFMRIYRQKEPGFFDKYDPMLIVTAVMSVAFILFMFISLLSSRELFRMMP